MQSSLVGSLRVYFAVVLGLLTLYEMFFDVVLLLLLMYPLGSFKDWNIV